jgi:hypothetical protein
VDGDIGRAERGPLVVGILAELLGEQLCVLEPLGRLAAVVAPARDDGGDEGQGAADGEAGGGVVVIEVGGADEGDGLGVNDSKSADTTMAPSPTTTNNQSDG